VSAVLEIEGVWKGYRDRAHPPGRRTLRGILVGGERRRRSSLLWALRDVSFSLPAGRGLALIGHNGAGKSTLLRLASGLGRPTRGRIAAESDTAAVLNLGATFDLRLTGAENALTTAMVNGYSRRDAEAAVPKMLAFSELEDFADAAVRTYSDGMKLRLAFGVLTHRRPRLLVVDEVLSIGDAAFRRRCHERITEMRADGTSLLLASHVSEDVLASCEDAVWLHRGEVRARGDAEGVLTAYEDAVRAATVSRTPVGAPTDGPLVLGENRFGSQEVVIEGVTVRGHAAGMVRTGHPLDVTLALAVRDEAVPDPIVGVAVRRAADETIVLDTTSDGQDLGRGRGRRRFEVQLTIDRVDLAGGEYLLDVGAYEPGWDRAYDFHYAAYPLTVEGPPGGKGVVVPPARWSRG
jgi:lipopolysaccharide transport system ATP-binding protein